MECLRWKAEGDAGRNSPVVSCVPLSSVTGLPRLAPDISNRVDRLVVRWNARPLLAPRDPSEWCDAMGED